MKVNWWFLKKVDLGKGLGHYGGAVAFLSPGDYSRDHVTDTDSEHLRASWADTSTEGKVVFVGITHPFDPSLTLVDVYLTAEEAEAIVRNLQRAIEEVKR